MSGKDKDRDRDNLRPKARSGSSREEDNSEGFPFGRPRDHYFELPKQRSKDLVTRDLPRIPKERLVQFKNLYEKQPQEIQELLRIPFCSGKPVVDPPPLSTFVARVRSLQDKKKQERRRRRQKLKEEIRRKWDKAGPGLVGEQRGPGTGTRKTQRERKAKVAVAELKREDTPLVHVDYPARVVHLEKALASMGGVGVITEVFNSVTKKLEVKFRPDDPFCNSVRGEATPSIGVLLRVRYRKKSKANLHDQTDRDTARPKGGSKMDMKNAEKSTKEDNTVVMMGGVAMSRSQILYEDSKLLKRDEQENEEFLNDLGKSYLKIPEKYETEPDCNVNLEVLGLVNRSYKFDGICDFQYLPSKPSSYGTASSREDVFPIIGIPSDNPETLFVCDRVIHGEDKNTHAVFIPPTMSRLDRPLDTALGQTMGLANVKLGSSVPDKSDVVSSTRSKRNISTVFYSFSADNPKPVPAEPIPGAMEDLRKRPSNELSLEVIKKCFNEKPVWNKVALEVESKISPGTLRYALPCVAYFVTNGPWRASWIKFGYDPRNHQSSFIYQTIDFRVPGIYKCFMEEPHNLNETFYTFKPSMIPPRGQMYYQLCHLKCDEIGKLSATANEKANAGLLEYDHKFGWLKEGTFDYLRYVITDHIESHLQEIGKIPETHREIITLPDGQLETEQKIQLKLAKTKRPRKVRFYKPKEEPVPLPVAKAQESHKKVGKSQWAFEGILEDLNVDEDQEGIDYDISASDEEIETSSSNDEEEEEDDSIRV